MVRALLRRAGEVPRGTYAISVLLLFLTGLFVLALHQEWLRTAALTVSLTALTLTVGALWRPTRLAFVGMFALAFVVLLLGRWLATLPSDRLYSEFSLETTKTTLVALFVAIVCVSVAPALSVQMRNRGGRCLDRVEATPAWEQFPRLAWLLLLVVVVCGALRVAENVMVARDVWLTGYVAQFAANNGATSFAWRYPSLMYDAFLAVFIAWRPRRCPLVLVLGLHALVMASSLFSGQRMYAVVWVGVLVAFVASAPPPWLGPLIRRRAVPLAVAAAVLLGSGVAGLSLIESMRSGSSSSGFLASQGVSYTAVAYAEEREADLPRTNTSYTFGRLEAELTGGPTYPESSVDEATRGNNLGATISWLVQPTVYAVGGGFGTSYVAELNTDFGAWAVGLYSLLVGAALIALPSLARRGWFAGAVTLLLARSLVIMPRDFALNWIFPFLSASVLAPLLGMAALTYLARWNRRRAPR